VLQKPSSGGLLNMNGRINKIKNNLEIDEAVELAEEVLG